MLFPLAAGIDHNSKPGRTAPGFFQRFAYSDNLKPESVSAFREWSRHKSSAFVEAIDDWLAKNESLSKLPRGIEHDHRPIAGVGVFYYEGPVAEEVISE